MEVAPVTASFRPGAELSRKLTSARISRACAIVSGDVAGAGVATVAATTTSTAAAPAIALFECAAVPVAKGATLRQAG
jgi:hypothetical protein